MHIFSKWRFSFRFNWCDCNKQFTKIYNIRLPNTSNAHTFLSPRGIIKFLSNGVQNVYAKSPATHTFDHIAAKATNNIRVYQQHHLVALLYMRGSYSCVGCRSRFSRIHIRIIMYARIWFFMFSISKAIFYMIIVYFFALSFFFLRILIFALECYVAPVQRNTTEYIWPSDICGRDDYYRRNILHD